MNEYVRRFEAGPDPFNRNWQVEFKWHQVGISIRHADTVDVKFFLTSGDIREEKVIAIRHPDLLAVSAKVGRPISDGWVIRLASLHLKRMIETGDDMEKTLVTVPAAAVEEHAREIEQAIPKSA